MRKISKKRYPKHLYHLSFVNHDEDVFEPRVPGVDSRNCKEDDETKRICMSSVISGCIRAKNDNIENGNILFVHEPDSSLVDINDLHLVKPNKYEVFDVIETKEIWVTDKIPMRCVGQIMVDDNGWNDDYVCKPIKWHWIKKFN